MWEWGGAKSFDVDAGSTQDMHLSLTLGGGADKLYNVMLIPVFIIEVVPGRHGFTRSPDDIISCVIHISFNNL